MFGRKLDPTFFTHYFGPFTMFRQLSVSFSVFRLLSNLKHLKLLKYKHVNLSFLSLLLVNSSVWSCRATIRSVTTQGHQNVLAFQLVHLQFLYSGIISHSILQYNGFRARFGLEIGVWEERRRQMIQEDDARIKTVPEKPRHPSPVNVNKRTEPARR